MKYWNLVPFSHIVFLIHFSNQTKFIEGFSIEDILCIANATTKQKLKIIIRKKKKVNF